MVVGKQRFTINRCRVDGIPMSPETPLEELLMEEADAYPTHIRTLLAVHGLQLCDYFAQSPEYMDLYNITTLSVNQGYEAGWLQWPDKESQLWARAIGGDIPLWVWMAKIYYLQFVANNTVDRAGRYWATIYMDQHVPLMDFLDRKMRAPTHSELSSCGLDPIKVVPICSESLDPSARTRFTKIFTAHTQRTADVVSTLLEKARGKRCSCRDLWEKVLERMPTYPELTRFFRFSLLGNHIEAQYRLSLQNRIKVIMADEKSIIATAKANPRHVEYSLFLYNYTQLQQNAPYSDVMREVMGWDEYWNGVCVLWDTVLRPTFDSGEAVSDARINGCQKKMCMNPLSKPPLSPIEVVSNIIVSKANKSRAPSFVSVALLKHFKGDFMRLFRETGVVSRSTLATLSRIVGDHSIIRKELPSTIKMNFSQEELDIMASYIAPAQRRQAAYLVPLTLDYYRAQNKHAGGDQKRFYICPMCYATNFQIRGFPRRPVADFFVDEQHDWIYLCMDCSPDIGVPTIRFSLCGYALVLNGTVCMLCCVCGKPSVGSSGAYGRGGVPYACSACSGGLARPGSCCKESKDPLSR